MADFDINRLPAKPTERVIKAKEMFLEENPEMCCHPDASASTPVMPKPSLIDGITATSAQ